MKRAAQPGDIPDENPRWNTEYDLLAEALCLGVKVT